MIVLTRANTKQRIWINLNNILYFHSYDKGAEIGLIDCSILVSETPEEIEEMINNLFPTKRNNINKISALDTTVKSVDMAKGKIYIGYPCIGKTTLALQDDKFIDLDSSTMMENPDGMGYEWVRREGWEEIYVNVAVSLTNQGYNVFLSSHDLVTKRLKSIGIEFTVIIPSIDLKDAWINKANERFLCSKSDKDRRALARMEEYFNEDVTSLISLNVNKIIISDINYSLKKLLTPEI